MLLLNVLPLAWLLTRLFRRLFGVVLFPVSTVWLAFGVGAFANVRGWFWSLRAPWFASFPTVLASFPTETCVFLLASTRRTLGRVQFLPQPVLLIL